MNLHTEFNTTEKIDRGQPVIKIENVAVRYRVPQEKIPSFKEYAIRWLKGEIKHHDFWALKHIDLTIHRGEVFGLIGPNGAGKSTLLKVVARILRPVEGRIRIYGSIAPLIELGAGFDYELTGRENIHLNGSILGFSRENIEARFDRIVDFAGLQEFIDAPIRTYSTGMVARLGFSIATDVRPEILIVDEILGVGDAEFQARSFERIQSFQGKGTTILLVSHSLESIKSMCTRAAWLAHGEIVASGTANSVVNQYREQTAKKEAKRLAKITDTRAIEKKAGGEAAWRTGTRKIKISRVRITDEQGIEKAIFYTGQTLILHMDYVTHGAVLPPIFGLAIHRLDGVHITGPNTKFADVSLPPLNGQGTITYTILKLPLLEGLYHFTVAATNAEDTEIYDYHDRAYPFRVIGDVGTLQERYGLLSIDAKWHHKIG